MKEESLPFYLSLERFHYVLKSGCGIEKLKSRYVQALSNLIFLYSLISIQTWELMYLSRKIFDLPGDVIFDEDEWQILYKIAHKKYIRQFTLQKNLFGVLQNREFLLQISDFLLKFNCII